MPYDPFYAGHSNSGADFTEGNGWEYTFMVPQDPDGLIALHGSDQAFCENLDSLFIVKGDIGKDAPPDVSGLIGMYAHGNEPNHHIPYLYVYAGQQWKTAAVVRSIEQQMYRDQPDGLSGNEDCGQMSAWYVMSALGLYQVNPSNGVYVFGSPLFPYISMNLPSGKKFTVIAHNNSSENIFIQSAKLNGKPYQKTFLTYNQIMAGGTLEFVMGSQPNKKFGADKNCRPVSAR
jgi:predicted alpha-1,2-mannosidase